MFKEGDIQPEIVKSGDMAKSIPESNADTEEEDSQYSLSTDSEAIKARKEAEKKIWINKMSQRRRKNWQKAVPLNAMLKGLIKNQPRKRFPLKNFKNFKQSKKTSSKSFKETSKNEVKHVVT